MRLSLPFGLTILCGGFLLFAPASQAAPATDTLSAQGGAIRITAKFHASTQVEYGGEVIAVDPIGFARWNKKADIILITHPHGDHFDPSAINTLKKPGKKTYVCAPAELASQLKAIKDISIKILKPGEVTLHRSGKAGRAIGIQAAAMYNLKRGPKAGQKYHPKTSHWEGYILTLGNKRLYFAGDTEFIPEMSKLRNIDAAFLPMNLPFTMTPQEAAKAARAIKPKIVYPYHYRYPFNKDSGNERTFAKLMQGSGIRVKLLEYYPAEAVKRATAKG